MANWRFNPFTSTANPTTISLESHTVEFHAEPNLYGFYLEETPQKTTPSSFSVVENVSGGATFTEVAFVTPPSSGEYRVDYDTTGQYATAFINFNAAHDGDSFLVSYKGLGTHLNSDESTPRDDMVGMIGDFPTATAPARWLVCDGSSKVRTDYPKLFAFLGVIYGAADSTHFNVPDYRGYFRRTWANGQTTDPDRASRTNRGDGTTGDNVGTIQTDAFEAHTHDVNTTPTLERTYLTGGVEVASYDLGTKITSSVGGNETRPLNKYVLTCIYAGE